MAVTINGSSGLTANDGSVFTDASGNVGIGTGSPQGTLHVTRNHGSQPVPFGSEPQVVVGGAQGGAGTQGYMGSLWFASSDSGADFGKAAGIVGNSLGDFAPSTREGHLEFYTTASGSITPAERMRIDSAGNVGIGNTNPTSTRLSVTADPSSKAIELRGRSADNVSALVFTNNDASTQYGYVQAGNTFLALATGNSERMRIDSSGNVGIGTATPGSNKLSVAGKIFSTGTISSGASVSAGAAPNANPDGSIMLDLYEAGFVGEARRLNIALLPGSGSTNRTVYYRHIFSSAEYVANAHNFSAGNVTIAGSLSKGSGSFKIDHPLPEKTDTHHLVHSFIEGPQADNIYRGKVELVEGRAEVNIDSVSGMTEGTFVVLNRAVQCFTSNESDWDAVRGSVNGNILTIECQNANSTATISWMVIGERKDKHMYDTDWTDDDGKVIVEPLKATVSVVAEQAPTEEQP